MFRGVTYGLSGGQAECTLSRKRGVIGRDDVTYCEFSRPGSLEVRTERGTYIFAPGPRKRATVWFVDGVPQCASQSRLDIERNMIERAKSGRQSLSRTLDPT
jgi:hypothetical protein